MGPRAGLDGGKSRPTGIRSPDRPALIQSLYRLSYPAQTKFEYKLAINWTPNILGLVESDKALDMAMSC